jgi:NAD(P)-dependent dehydrogenase (short-subunit alcohol dehydrogenase family)
MKLYSKSKLANILVSNHFAKKHSDVLVSCALHPGAIRTDLVRRGLAYSDYSCLGSDIVNTDTHLFGSGSSNRCTTAPHRVSDIYFAGMVQARGHIVLTNGLCMQDRSVHTAVGCYSCDAIANHCPGTYIFV